MDVGLTPYNDWKYVSEGGATIVFSYIGPSNASFDGMVLRLRKVKATASMFPSHQSSLSLIDGLQEDDDPSIEFQHRCMEKLISPALLPELSSVTVNSAWLTGLSDFHNSSRPMERRVKDQIDVYRGKAVLATDLVGGNWLSIEIKPKWGFLSSPYHLSMESREIKTRYCRFCMHSRLKVSQGELASLGYCPLDLFSGDRDRVEQALNSLWESWTKSNGAVNNLRIFAKGEMVKPDDGSYLDSFAKFLPLKEGSDIRDRFVSSVATTLVDSPVLRILSTLQRNLDALDIEGLSSLWTRSYRETVPEGDIPPLGVDTPLFNCSEPTIDEWVTFVEQFQKVHEELDHKSAQTSNLRYYLLAYLLSATFKDCSLILRVRSEPTTADASKVAIIDLDPKSLKRLHKWQLLDKEILDAFGNGLGTMPCVDAERKLE